MGTILELYTPLDYFLNPVNSVQGGERVNRAERESEQRYRKRESSRCKDACWQSKRREEEKHLSAAC